MQEKFMRQNTKENFYIYKWVDFAWKLIYVGDRK